MEALHTFILSQSEDGFVSTSALKTAATDFKKSLREVEIFSLQNGIIPRRYERNIGSISIEQQIMLLKSKCLVVGCGGLGGYILEELGRLGVGTIMAIDHDVFQESNLNRQLLANFDNIGKPKVAAAKERLALVNPAVDFIAYQEALSADNAAVLIAGLDVVIDALDNFEARRVLLSACSQAQIPLVGGSIAGWYGMVYYCLKPSLASLTMAAAFAGLQGNNRGIEKELGNPAFIPALVGSLESAFVCRLLIEATPPNSKSKESAGKIFFIDTLNMSFESFDI